jgi:hypothetical protein
MGENAARRIEKGANMKAKQKPKVVEAEKRLKHLGGSENDAWNRILADQAMQTNWFKNSDAETQEKQISATLGALCGIGPKDEIEGMLAAQMLAAHNAAMECYRRAMIGEQTFDGRSANLNFANKLSRTHAALVEALNRHRGKGTQVVRVERVVVNEGGQAIVGTVEAGGRVATKSEDQPHAKQIADASGDALLCPVEAEREAMPVASGARL